MDAFPGLLVKNMLLSVKLSPGNPKAMTNEPSETTDLLRRLHAGDRDALAGLFDYYRSRLGKMVRVHLDTRLAGRFDASDVLQEAFLDAVRQLPAYLRQPRVAFYVWLRGVAWERLLNLQRQHAGAQCRAVGRELALPAKSSALLARSLLAPGPSPSEILLQAELRQRLQRALARLDPEDREVILMRHFENLSNGEVAQALGIGDSGATMRYGRALFRLKEILVGDLASGESTP
jgi:RNA polymerase sigma-70 factor (ECF subfamily)